MKVFAHRGASAYAPQNTLPSFSRALELNAPGIELDVQLTSDGVPVVIHDFTLEKTTDLKGFVHRTSWKELRQGDAGLWFSREFRGTAVPSLEEVLAFVPPEVCLNVEIKSISSLNEPVARIVAELLSQEKERNLIVSSFNHPILKEFQTLAPEIPIGILTGNDLIGFFSYVDQAGLKPFSLHPEASYITQEYMREAHERDWEVLTYTINSRSQALMMEQLGVDGVFSDFPDLLAQ